MKKSRKSFLLAMMAILVAAGLAGCGRGNSASGQQTENANGRRTSWHRRRRRMQKKTLLS